MVSIGRVPDEFLSVGESFAANITRYIVSIRENDAILRMSHTRWKVAKFTGSFTCLSRWLRRDRLGLRDR